jgi:uncharacterized RDD family membrane protein YckC
MTGPAYGIDERHTAAAPSNGASPHSDVEPNGTGPSSAERASRVTQVASRFAFAPVRAAGRAWRKPLEAVAEDVLAAPEVGRVIDGMLAGPLPEELVQSIVRHRVIERVVAGLAESGEFERIAQTLVDERAIDRITAQLADSGEIERLVAAALTSPRTPAITDSVLASDVTQSALRHIAASPELRYAIAQQTTGLTQEVVASVRGATNKLDDRVEDVVRRRTRAEHGPFAGVATRALALIVDTGATLVLFMAVAGAVALFSSLVGGLRPEWLVGVLLGSGWLLIFAAYFTLFWSAAGQTPGMRLVQVRVQRASGDGLSVWRSLLRVVGLVLSIVPLFLGFASVLFSGRRRGFADWLAGTVVVYDE